jgi:hypothetical protein
VTALEAINEVDEEIAEHNAQLKALKAKRDQLARVAVEEIQVNRLDGVKAAGRNWRVEFVHSLSATECGKEAVMEAAKAAGLLDVVTQINTSALKAALTERAKEAGRDASQPYSAGTPFEGLVSEYVRPELFSVRLPKK